MSAAILSILAALVPLAVWLIRRRVARADDPTEQQEKRYEQNAREIINDDEAAANRRLDNDLRRLRALQGDQQRQDRPPHEGS